MQEPLSSIACSSYISRIYRRDGIKVGYQYPWKQAKADPFYLFRDNRMYLKHIVAYTEYDVLIRQYS